MTTLETAYRNLVIAEYKYDGAIGKYLEVVESLPLAIKLSKLDEIEETLEKIKNRLSQKRQKFKETEVQNC